MTEQYIYSRSEREFTNALNQTIPLGFGFMALSPGMDDTLKRDVKVHCEDCPRLFQADGRSVPIRFFRKAHLPKGRILLQESKWNENSSRDFHVAHGYVLDESALAAGPAKWLAAEFRLEDPNRIPGGIPPLESLSELPGQEFPEFHPLREAALGLDMESYCQLLLACFDAVASRRQVLIAWNFEPLKEWELRRSVLYWIYTFLPYDLWTVLGFDSVYTDRSSPGMTHLAFVDRTLIQDRGETSGIQLGNQLLSLGGNFLVRKGGIIHSDGKYKTEWYGRRLPCADWIKQLVDMAWNSPEERRDDVLQALEDARKKLQHEMRSVPEAERLSVGTYNRACERAWKLLKRKGTAVPAKPDPPTVAKPARQMVTSALPRDKPAAVPAKAPGPSPSEMYQGIFKRRMSPTSEDLNALASMCGEVRADAIGLLSAFMARDVYMSKIEQLMDKLNYYKGLPNNVYPQLLPRLFWDKLTGKERTIWKDCDVESGDGAAENRRFKYYGTIACTYEMPKHFTEYVRGVLDGLPGISAEQRKCMEKECFKRIDIFFEVGFKEISSHRTTMADENDIQPLVRQYTSAPSGWTRAAALGILGAFMARDADSPKYSPTFVLKCYQGWLQTQPALYTRLLSRLFWYKMTDVECYAWKKCGVTNSDEAAQERRKKLYDDILKLSLNCADSQRENVESYATSYIRRILGTNSDISEQERTQMENELKSMIK